MTKIRMKCRGKMVTRELHKTETGKKYVMERKPGGGTKRLYIE